jgi:hypothetical protein
MAKASSAMTYVVCLCSRSLTRVDHQLVKAEMRMVLVVWEDEVGKAL